MSTTSFRPPGDPALVPTTALSYWDHAIRLAAGADTVAALTHLATACIGLSTAWGCSITLSIEPDGDVSETGHFVEVHIEGTAVWADMAPWPERFGGSIPDRLHAELDLAGWLVVGDGADPAPIRSVYDIAVLRTAEQQESTELPVRRLVAFGDTDDLTSWAVRVAHAIDRVLAPRSNRWYLTGTADAIAGGALDDYASNHPGQLDGDWTVDLRQLLGPAACEPAVWPSGSEAAYQACLRGLHQLHEPPCFGASGSNDQHDDHDEG